VKFNKWVVSARDKTPGPGLGADLRTSLNALLGIQDPRCSITHSLLPLVSQHGLISVTAHVDPSFDLAMNPEPELLATPSNFANATARHGLVDTRSLEARQGFCDGIFSLL
jgi:hypothetical protein